MVFMRLIVRTQLILNANTMKEYKLLLFVCLCVLGWSLGTCA
jgi:hypothetical protein